MNQTEKIAINTTTSHLKPRAWWLVVVERKEQIILINHQCDGFWIHGQETEWRLDHVQEWICEIVKPEKAAKSITSALYDCSTLRHGMFTPPQFPSICSHVILRTLKGFGRNEA